MANSRRGYTFIESIVTIGIIAILSGFVWPGVVSRAKMEENMNFKAHLARLPSQAREVAVSANKTYHIAMDGDKKIVLKPENDDGNLGEAVETITIPDSTSTKDLQVLGQSKLNGDWDVRFFADGTSDQAGISFVREQINFALNIDDRGHGKVDDELADSTTQTWPAGTYEERS